VKQEAGIAGCPAARGSKLPACLFPLTIALAEFADGLLLAVLNVANGRKTGSLQALGAEGVRTFFVIPAIDL